MTPQEKQAKKDKHRPKGRKMPHPHEAKKDDGSYDLDDVKAALPGVVESFESGEYVLRDMNEGQIVQNNVKEIGRVLGVSAQVGDEFFVVIRKKS